MNQRKRKMPKNELNDLILLGESVLIEQIRDDEIVEGGLIKGAQDEDKAHRGNVLMLGHGLGTTMMQEGDVIYFNQYAPTKFYFRGKEYLILHAEDIRAIEKRGS